MKQAERFFACRGFTAECSVEWGSVRMHSLTLIEIMDGYKISELLGNYGLYRELFKVESVKLNAVCFAVGDVLVTMQDEENIYPSFQRVNSIFITDSRECFLLCSKVFVVTHNIHFQAYEVLLLDELKATSAKDLLNLLSPWPLKIRVVGGVSYVSLRHKV